MAPLKTEAISACEAALRPLGFIKRAGTLLQERREGSSGWIGLNVATQGLPDCVKVNPVIGVYFTRYGEIERSLRDDIPRKPRPIVSRPLGYLMPEKSFRAWEFQRDGDNDIISTSLAEAVKSYGEPFLEEYSDWENFSLKVESSGLLMEHEREKTLPIILAINGDLTRARKMIANELARVSGHDDMYAQSYRDFADKFLSRFGTSI